MASGSQPLPDRGRPAVHLLNLYNNTVGTVRTRKYVHSLVLSKNNTRHSAMCWETGHRPGLKEPIVLWGKANKETMTRKGHKEEGRQPLSALPQLHNLLSV